MKEKWLCYSCDSKYTKGHKCAEKKLFYIDCEEGYIADLKSAIFFSKFL